MEILKDFDLHIDEKEILRLLGFKDSEPDEEMLEGIRDEIERCNTYLEPQLAFEKLNIKVVEEKRVLLENDVVFEGEFIANKLRNCKYVIVCLSTVGPKLDSEVKGAFDSGDYFRGMIVDNIGITSVGYVNKTFWNRMVDDIAGTNIGITSRLSPGDTAWNISEQKKIFECLDGAGVGLTLSDSSMMVPFKSTSAVYGFGEGIGIARMGHVCSECSMKHCAYRADGKVQLTVVNKYGDDEIIDVKPGSNLLEVLRENNIFVPSHCSGKGTCGKCRVQIVSGAPAAGESDKRHLSEEAVKMGIRLSCNVRIDGAMTLKSAPEDINMNVLTEGNELSVEPNPAVVKKYCSLDIPSVEDQRDDLRRLKEAFGTKNLRVSFSDMSKISSLLRQADFKVTGALYEDRLLSLECSNTENMNFGLAVDIGTTTIAAYLVDLNSGKTIDVESQVNRQRTYGADVISRINYTIEKENGLETLKNLIVGQLNAIINNLCSRNGVEKDNIYDTVLVGNTTMIHLLLGLPCRNIAMAPYIPVTTSALTFEASEIGLITKGVVSIVPGVASYVGSDITAGILSSGMLDSEKYSLLLDLGTNGEIALGNKYGVTTCSTAAGPAFEGANIKCGIGGIKGAISKIDLSKDKVYETIGNERPCGICGSGVLDAAAQLIKYGLADETGRMVDEDELEDEKLIKRLVEVDGIKGFMLEESSQGGEPIVFTQKDLREVQLAKAAIAAGIKILLKEKGIESSDVESIYIGGGFGNYMDIDSSLAIGMLPIELKGRIKSVGNCAGSGARMYLLSMKLREETDRIIERTDYIELSKREDFQEYFIDSMMFE